MELEQWTLAMVTRRCRRLLSPAMHAPLKSLVTQAADRSGIRIDRVVFEPDCIWVWLSCPRGAMRRFAELARAECGHHILSTVPPDTAHMLQERVWDWPFIARQDVADHRVRTELDLRRASHRDARLGFLPAPSSRAQSGPSPGP